MHRRSARQDQVRAEGPKGRGSDGPRRPAGLDPTVRRDCPAAACSTRPPHPRHRSGQMTAHN